MVTKFISHIIRLLIDPLYVSTIWIALLDQCILGTLIVVYMWYALGDSFRETIKEERRGFTIMASFFAVLWFTVGTWGRVKMNMPLLGITPLIADWILGYFFKG